MIKKKLIAGFMAITMFMASIPQTIQAQVLDPPTKLEILEIKHELSETGATITPTIAIRWEPPLIPGDDTDPNRTYGYRVGITEINDNGTRSETFYSRFLSEDTLSLQLEDESFQYKYTGNAFTPAGEYVLQNGSKYEITVVYSHRIVSEGTNGNVTITEMFASENPKKTVVTDFNPVVETTPTGLLVSWEYVQGLDYEMGYIPGIKNDASEITGDLANIVILTAEQVQSTYYNPDTDRVEYAITVGLAEQYSVYVKAGSTSIDQGIESNQVYEDLKVSIGLKGIDLTVEDMDGTNIQVSWTGQIANALIQDLERVQIYESNSQEQQGTLAKTKEAPIQGEYFILERPTEITYYTVQFFFRGMDEPIIAKVMYNPAQRVKPPTPTIPNPFNPNIDEDYLEANEKEFLVSDDHTQVNLEDIESFQERTFHTYFEGDDIYIQLVWDLPKEIRDMTGKGYTVGYDLWVDDKPIEERDEPDQELIYMEDLTDFIFYPDEEPVGFKAQLTIDGQPFKTNTTYYIQLRAKNIYGEDDIQYSDPVQVSITIDKDGYIFVPPVIGNPPLDIKNDSQGKPMITQSEITIEWPTEWMEIYARSSTLLQYGDTEIFGDLERRYAQYGNAQIYLPEQAREPMIRFREGEQHLDERLLVGTSQEPFEIDALINEINALYVDDTTFNDEYGYRSIFLDEEIEYEIAVLTYVEAEQMAQELIGNRNIEEFVSEIRPEEPINAELGWQTISPVQGRDQIWLEHQIQGLQPSTEYLILFRAYRQTPEGALKQLFPSYVIGTTASDYVTEEPTPTVPTIAVKEGSETDTSFTVYWEYDDNFEYELVYNVLSDIGSATNIEMEEDVNLHFVERNGKTYAEVTIYGLFPETSYYVWLKAKQIIGEEESLWSNPAIGTTKEVRVPDIPTGLGPASNYSILEAGYDFEAIGSDYITVEWNKDRNDDGFGTQGTITKWYEYDIEIAEDASFEGAEMITVSDDLTSTSVAEVLSKSLAKFIDLKPDTYYYFRIRTRLRLEDSLTEKVIEKESEYSTWVRISTKTTNDEYDGGENDNIVTYPDITEESFEDGIWELEIVDAQTVISDIVTSREYFYTIDMELYENEDDAVIRRLKIPIAIMEALSNQNMELKVNTFRASYEIPAQTLSYMLKGVSATDIVQFDFHTMLAYDMREFGKTYPYELEGAEELSVKVRSEQTGVKEVKQFDGNIAVKLKLQDPTAYHYDTFKTYTHATGTGQWIGEQYRVENEKDVTYMTYTTPRLGIYSLYKVNNHAQSNDINYAMQEVMERYNIEGLGVDYTATDNVKGTHYIQIILGVAQDYVDIQLTDTLTPQQSKMAQAIGINVDTDAVTQEQAIHGVMKLYEMQTGYRVQGSARDVSQVSPAYREGVSKAYAIGIIENIEPTTPIDYGQFSEWLMSVDR